MSNINFTCPHCSFQKQLPASAVGQQGNCPNCNAVVTITADATANPQVSPQQPVPQQQLLQQQYTQQNSPTSGKNLKPCKECGNQIASNANKCPHCGRRIPLKERSKRLHILFYASMGFILFCSLLF